MPRWSLSENGDRLGAAAQAAWVWAQGRPPANRARRPEIARRIHASMRPALNAAVWARWLFLERALLDASETGDLLFAALVLRTMCEEVQRFHVLDLSSDLVASDEADKEERLRLFWALASASLADLPEEMVLYGKGWPCLRPAQTEMPRLEAARTALNSYVHPNYGSHIAALFPERSVAARILLAGVAAVYDGFFALSWSEQPVTGETLPLGVGMLELWSRTVRRLRSKVIPDLLNDAESADLAGVLKVPEIVEHLAEDRPDLDQILENPELAPLLKGLPRRPASKSRASVSSKYRMWEGARAIDVLAFMNARRAEQLLANEFPLGAPEPTEQVRWLRFNSLSLQLGALIHEIKAAAFTTQLARQLAQGNSLGIWLCVRPLIEHRALITWLPEQVRASLDSLAGKVKAGERLPEIAEQVTEPLAKFLAADAERSEDERRSWVTRQDAGTRHFWLNLGKIVRTAFDTSDRIHKMYALASAVMHGRADRGLVLVLHGRQLIARAREIGLLLLDRICDHNERAGYRSATGVQLMRLEHAGAFGGTLAAATDGTAQRAFGLIEGLLVLGVDYVGEGTEEAPFRLGPHLVFYGASYALLRQFGVDIDASSRELIKNTARRFCDRWQARGREFWFQAPDPNS